MAGYLAGKEKTMKPFFIRSSVPEVPYLRGAIVLNNPVNLNLVTSIELDTFNWYPDNEGLPAIKFRVVGDADVTWVYKTKEARDADLNKIEFVSHEGV